ncbi:DUF2878 domain-containing protein [Polynucleobacter antarcticus]|uniref:DUF2878 domain-containing protein n=1 Tax=Polynucleobacter antarcticus TaxID=1743162 RepID=A0A6M9Q491_9BURK|nr:DUF2878 domain-containing protein [Polynucleobacter antarcticus]QKM63313.1 DUF2878 domain-containing protein [Polynucleobacter antarcticus]
MAKFWNFVFFQLGWFACILGAANHFIFWPVLATLAYIAVFIWRADKPASEFQFILKAVIFGVSADSLIAYLGFLSFEGSWPSAYLSPLWMWTLWALLATTINESLSWLRKKPILAVVLGAIAGPLSYEAGIRMGAGAWGPSGQIGGLVLLAIIWGVAMPLFFYWTRPLAGPGLLNNPS